MASPAQIVANRSNAQLSTGPKTETGKARVSVNASKHGLSGRHIILPGESAEQFDSLVADLQDRFGHLGPLAHTLSIRAAELQWKLQRLTSIETGIFEQHMDQDNPDIAAVFVKCSDLLLKLSRYEATIQRSFSRTLDTLLKLDRDHRRDAGTRAAQRQGAVNQAFDEFLDAYVNAPMPGQVAPQPTPLVKKATG